MNQHNRPISELDKDLVDIMVKAKFQGDQLTNEDKHAVFRQAYLTSNQLIA